MRTLLRLVLGVSIVVLAQSGAGAFAATSSVKVPQAVDPEKALGTHLAPPDNPRHESVEETAARAQAMAVQAGTIGDRIAHAEQALLVSGFMPAFAASLVMIILSEIGDKTFFIAAILAMRHSRVVVFLGAISALAVMTVLSAAMGYAAPALLPKTMTHYAGVALFAYFGQQLIRDGLKAGHGVSEELEETEDELSKRDEDLDSADVEEGGGEAKPQGAGGASFLSPVLMKTFSLTFFAEWGDRSQIATIALAASKDPFGVTLGGILGHSLCTGIAVIGGRMLAARISEKTMLLLGGVVFLVFAVLDLIKGPD